MPVESANFIHELEESFPAHEELVSEGDDHLRLIKMVIKATFPEVTGSTTATHEDLTSYHTHRKVLELLAAEASVVDEELESNFLLKKYLTNPTVDFEEDAKIPIADESLQTGLNAEMVGGRKIFVSTENPTDAQGDDGDLWFVRTSETL